MTERGDLALKFITVLGNDPSIPQGKLHPSQFLCTREDAKQIARMTLRTLAFWKSAQKCDFGDFRNRIESSAIRALADNWNDARGNGRLPSWKDIKPASAAPYLSRMWGFDMTRAALPGD